MPAVVPVVMSFAAAGSAVAAAGGIAAAMGTVTGFLAVAGAALTTVGVLTGKKDLTKVGSLMGLGSSLISGFGNAAAGQAASEAASEAAGEAASEQAAQEGFRALEHADASAAAGGAGADVAADAAGAGTVAGGSGEAATLQTAGMDQAMSQAAKAGAASDAIDPLQRANEFLNEASTNSASVAAKPSIFDSAQEAFRRGELNSNSIYGEPIGPAGVTINGQVMRVAPDAVADGARGLTSDQVRNLVNRGDNRVANMLDRGGFRRAEILDMNASPGAAAPIAPSGVTIGGRVFSTGGAAAGGGGEMSLWDRAAALAGRAGQFIERNPNLALVGGKMLAGAFGPESEELDWRKSIYARKLANLNSPVRLTFGGGS